MPSFLDKFRSSATGSNPASNSSPSKKDSKDAPQTWLQKLNHDPEPVREDGSDKFFGAENFGNTCYFNSIIQCLYYNVHFREMVLNYPTRSPKASILNSDWKARQGVPQANGQAGASPAKPKTAATLNLGRAVGTPGTPQKPEDKDSPEYKKKQALANGPHIVLDYDNSNTYGMTESLFTCLKDTFESIIANPSRTGVVSPTQFLEMLRKENEMFRSTMHQDAHEFLNLLLNGVVEAVEQHSKKIEAGQSANGHAPNGDFHHALSTPSTMGTKPSAIHGLFEGTLTSETKCLTCENTSQRDEPFLDLSVDLDQHSSVTSCLRKFSEEEMLCERDKFFCDNCGGLQEAEKRMKIKRLPKILALHLKRFKYTEDLQRLQKLFHRVVYPYHLRLFNTTDDAEDPDRLYELYAVVVHIGSGPYHGHYVSIIKTPNRGWLLFDDEMVEPVDKSFVRNFFGAQLGMACAYVLFYQETTLEAVKKEQEAEGLAAAAAAAAAATNTTQLPNGRETQGLGLSLKINGSHSPALPQTTSPPNEDDSSNAQWASLTRTTTAPANLYHNAAAGSPLSPSTTLQATPLLPSHTTTPSIPSSVSQPPKLSTAVAAATNPTSQPLSPSKSAVAAAKKQTAREEKERKVAEKERERAEKAAEKAKRKSTDTPYRASVRAQATSLISSLGSNNKRSSTPGGIEEETPKPPSTAGSTSPSVALSAAQHAHSQNQPQEVETQKNAPSTAHATTDSTLSTGAATAAAAGHAYAWPAPPVPLHLGTTQPPPEPTNQRPGSFSGGASGALSRFKQSSKSLSRKPKFWPASASSGSNGGTGPTSAPSPAANIAANAAVTNAAKSDGAVREADDVAVEDAPMDDGEEIGLVNQAGAGSGVVAGTGAGLGTLGTGSVAKKRGFSIRKKASAMLS